MGAEVGATTSTFPYIRNMQSYLHATRRGPVAQAADKAAAAGYLSADKGAEYDEVIEIVRPPIKHFDLLLTPCRRTSQSWSRPSMGLSHPISQLLFLSLGTLPGLKAGRTKSVLV